VCRRVGSRLLGDNTLRQRRARRAGPGEGVGLRVTGRETVVDRRRRVVARGVPRRRRREAVRRREAQERDRSFRCFWSVRHVIKHVLLDGELQMQPIY
jgi:hypothetical protein